MNKVALRILCAASVFAATACWPFSDDDALGEMRIRRVKGSVTVVRDGEVHEVSDEFALEVGDLVEAEAALATLRLVGGRRADLKGSPKIEIADDHSIDVKGQAQLLAHADESFKVRFGEVTASGSEALFRVDLGFGSSRVASYEGSVELTAPGHGRLPVDALFQATVAANELPPEPQPIRVSQRDPWDTTYLGEVVELDGELRDLAAGLRRQIGRQTPDLAYFRALAGGTDVRFVRSYLNRPAPDLLIGFTVADTAPGRGLRGAFIRTFRLYDDSAGHWGVVATIMNARPGPLVAQLDAILGPVAAGGAGGGDVFTVAAAQAAQDDGAFAPGPPAGPPGGGGQPTTRPTNRPPTSPSPTPKQCDDYVECAENDVREKIFPSPSPSPTD